MAPAWARAARLGEYVPQRPGFHCMRPNRPRLSAFLVVIATLLAACSGTSGSASGTGSADSVTPTPSETSGTPPQFTAERLGGGELTSASFAGTDTVLWFWAPWCTSCRAESDDVVAAARAMDGKVEVIGVAGRGEIPAMEGFVSDTGTGALTHVVDADGSIWTSYGVFAQPAYAFIDDSGSFEVFVGALGESALIERMTALAEG